MTGLKERNIITDVLAQAKATGHLGVARLMSPEETEEALKEQGTVDSRIEGWFLCGELHPEMWALLQAHPKELVMSANIIDTPSGGSFLVAYQRIRHWSHCFSVPLSGNAITSFTKAMEDGEPFQLSLANGEKDDTFIISPHCPPLLLEHLRRSCHNDIEDIPTMVQDMAELAATLTLRKVSSQKEEASVVTDVCVSPLIPDEIVVAAEALRVHAMHGTVH